MATTGYLIDTNAAIDYLGEAMPQSGLAFMDNIIDKEYNISVISRIELYAYSKLTEKDKETLDIFTGQASSLNINDEIIEKTIELRKTHKTKLPDAIIAATALVCNLALVSHNVKDFKNITGLSVIDPYSL
ncbi:MAG TPA: type II toxin-antitoxin system VapC family toxin [Bacteroidales bacterium]|nr:type II toxin-antitoxin system VapC family toxin [Bacteroidales bacterium]